MTLSEWRDRLALMARSSICHLEPHEAADLAKAIEDAEAAKARPPPCPALGGLCDDDPKAPQCQHVTFTDTGEAGAWCRHRPALEAQELNDAVMGKPRRARKKPKK